jgi:hypothetical protein
MFIRGFLFLALMIFLDLSLFNARDLPFVHTRFEEIGAKYKGGR